MTSEERACAIVEDMFRGGDAATNTGRWAHLIAAALRAYGDERAAQERERIRNRLCERCRDKTED